VDRSDTVADAETPFEFRLKSLIVLCRSAPSQSPGSVHRSSSITARKRLTQTNASKRDWSRPPLTQTFPKTGVGEGIDGMYELPCSDDHSPRILGYGQILTAGFVPRPEQLSSDLRWKTSNVCAQVVSLDQSRQKVITLLLVPERAAIVMTCFCARLSPSLAPPPSFGPVPCVGGDLLAGLVGGFAHYTTMQRAACPWAGALPGPRGSYWMEPGSKAQTTWYDGSMCKQPDRSAAEK
jgi:hypothetical protein